MLMTENTIKRKLLEACIEHICDLGYKPHVTVETKHPKYYGPPGAGLEPQPSLVTLNIGVDAVRSFYIDDDGFGFSYVSKGIPGEAYVPMEAVALITAKEDVSISQIFPYLIVDKEQESGKVTPSKPKTGFKPRIINGGKD